MGKFSHQTQTCALHFRKEPKTIHQYMATMRHLQNVYSHSSTSCDEHNVSIDIVNATLDSLNCLVHEHASQNPNDNNWRKCTNYLCIITTMKSQHGIKYDKVSRTWS